MAATSRPAVTIEQIQAAVTSAVTIAMTSQRASDREAQIVLTENVKKIGETTERLSHAVFGNGKDGLDKRVDRLEQAKANSPWRSIGLRVMELVVVGVVVAVLVLIQQHGIQIK